MAKVVESKKACTVNPLRMSQPSRLHPLTKGVSKQLMPIYDNQISKCNQKSVVRSFDFFGFY